MRRSAVIISAGGGSLLWVGLMAITLSLAFGPGMKSSAAQLGPALAHLKIDAVQSFDGLHTIVSLKSALDDTVDADITPRALVNFVWSVDGAEAARSKDGGAVLVFPKAMGHVVQVSGLDRNGDARAEGSLTLAADNGGFELPEAVGDASRSVWYLTLPQPGSLFATEGPIQRSTGFDGVDDSFKMVANVDNFVVYKALKTGYFDIRGADNSFRYDLFVSPVPSHHVDRADRDWYLTQWNTETQSNCGPTVTAMGIRWASGQDVGVVDVRKLIGWQGDGAVSFEQLQAVLNHYNVSNHTVQLKSPADIFDVLDRNHLLAVSYNMAGVEPVKDPSHDLLGQYYYDEGGHYLALKGYSLDRKYIIVYDPIPSDWGENRLRYGDGSSMIGRNRYYPVDELWSALRTYQALEILR